MPIIKEFILDQNGINLNEFVENLLQEKELKDGMLYLNLTSPTSALMLTNTFDSKTYDDLIDCLNQNCPTLVKYKTNISPFHSSGRIKSSLINNQLLIGVKNGRCILGSSQAIVAIEFDGPRKTCLEMEWEPIEAFEKYEITLTTKQHEFHDVTEVINECIKGIGVENGYIYLLVPHSTAGLWIESKSDLFRKEASYILNKMVPEVATFKHRETPEDAAGHLKTAITGVSAVVKVEKGMCDIEKNQAIYFLEFDGPRTRKIIVLTGKEVNVYV